MVNHGHKQTDLIIMDFTVALRLLSNIDGEALDSVPVYLLYAKDHT